MDESRFFFALSRSGRRTCARTLGSFFDAHPPAVVSAVSGTYGPVTHLPRYAISLMLPTYFKGHNRLNAESLVERKC